MTPTEKVAVAFGLGTATVVAVGLAWMFKETNVPTDDASSSPPPATVVDHEARTAAKDALRKEEKVKDLLWEGDILYVGVLDDGTRRDGFASYVCQVLREHRADDDVTVIVKDIAKLTAGQHVELGKSRC